MRSKWLSLFALVLALGLVTAACSSNKTTAGGGPSAKSTPSEAPSATASASAGGTITINGDTANNHGEKEVSKETEVEVDDFYFSPTVIKAAPGTKVKLELSNESSTLHNFSLPDQSIDQDVQPSGKQDVTVTIPKSGQVEFFCKYHKGSGMVGAIEAS